MEKKCRKCGLEKELNQFPKHRSNKDGYDSLCKVCTNEDAKQRRLKNSEKVKEQNEKYKQLRNEIRESDCLTEKECAVCHQVKEIINFSVHHTNKDGYNNKCKKCVNNYGKEHRDKHHEKELERSKNYYINNKEKILEIRKQYCENNKEKILERQKEYRLKNKEKIKIYLTLNKEKIRKRNNDYIKNRMLIDPLFNLKRKIKNTIRDSFRNQNYKKNDRMVNILGCTINEFKIHLESLWEDWMNWDNYGLYNGELNYGWDIDHIVPSSSAKTEEELIKLNHYTNLQPLCSKVNRDIKRACSILQS